MSPQHGSSLHIILHMLLLSSAWDDELSSSQVFCSLTLKVHYSMAISELLGKINYFHLILSMRGNASMLSSNLVCGILFRWTDMCRGYGQKEVAKPSKRLREQA